MMGVVPDEGCEDGGSVKRFNDEGYGLCNDSEVRYRGEGGCFDGDGRSMVIMMQLVSLDGADAWEYLIRFQWRQGVLAEGPKGASSRCWVLNWA
ncbi:hypothetical protein V6N13_048800 [Hibiscus sabdariffa]